MAIQTNRKMIFSAICSAVAVAGVVSTAVSAVAATPRAIEILKSAEREKGEPLDISEKVKAAWKVYIPTAVIGLSSIACIVGASVLGRKAQVSAAGAYMAVANTYEQYKLKNIEVNGLEVHRKVIDALAAEKSNGKILSAGTLCGQSCLDFGDEDDEALFYDVFSERYFTSTVNRVLQAEYHFNRNFVLRGMACINEFYEFLGIKPIEDGSCYGYTCDDGLSWVDFDHHKTALEDGLEAHVIDIPWEPQRIDLYL